MAQVARGVTVLDRYGWDERVARHFDEHSPAGMEPGRVLVEHRGQYVVATPSGERDAVVSGRLRHNARGAADFPAVGDWVALSQTDGVSAVVHAILPRHSQFVRPGRADTSDGQIVAANVDVVLLVSGLDHDFNLRRIERYATLAWSSGAAPVIVLNKADVCDDVAGRVADVGNVAPGIPIRVLSALNRGGLDSLTPLLEPGKTVALIGSSGVGKSTLVNALLGWQRQQTNAVRDDDQRGRHTTTVRELVPTEWGALLIDSPGMRSVGMWDSEDGLAGAFADVETFAAQCRFNDCLHEGEPGCEVTAAIADGRLPASRLDSYRKLGREAAAQARKTDAGLRASERRRWKMIHKSVRIHMNAKYGPEA
jgi:ribosome biogenesis GTPase / thiamine phosphate phosphatase